MKLIIYTISILFVFVQSLFFSAPTNDKVLNYIETYKHLAVAEMHRTGIPASIKMAQALLESSHGTSQLATKANNHFGIKCGNSWTGGTFYIYDDDYKNGKKIKSCFRAYNDVYESFIAHSDFISNPNKERYALLFYFPSTDYKSWAYGLKDAGYATDPKYPKKLIAIIEKYNLYELDEDTNGNSHLMANNESNSVKSYQIQTPNTDNLNQSRENDNISETVMITERGKSEPASPTSKHRSKTKKTNKSERKSKRRLPSQKPKTSKAVSDYYVVQEGDSMRDISRKFGIPLVLLYSKNRMPLKTEPLVGERIQLKGNIRIGDRPKFVYPDKHADSEFLLTAN